jgi:hypothetical protein
MKEKFTTQDVIDMASELYDNKGFTRAHIRQFLYALVDNGKWDASWDTVERVFDLIVG